MRKMNVHKENWREMILFILKKHLIQNKTILWLKDTVYDDATEKLSVWTLKKFEQYHSLKS